MRALLPILLALAGCRPTDTFRCELDQQCRRGSTFGFCEPVGYCSFIDGACASAHRYDGTAGEDLAGQCVPLDVDAGVDAPQWPCGAKPAAPPSTVTRDVDMNGAHQILSLRNTLLTGGTVVEVAPGASITMGTNYSIVDCICPGCIDQIEIGFVPGPRLACIYDGNPNINNPCEPPTTGTAVRMLTAPMTPGLYELRFGLSQDFACADHPSWYQDMPPMADTTVAYVCVR